MKRVYIPEAGRTAATAGHSRRSRTGSCRWRRCSCWSRSSRRTFWTSSFGFRPGKSAHQAVDAIRQHLAAGLREVYDADLQGYFDTIPHDQLLECLRMRIADRSVLHLIAMWLDAPVEERDDSGRTTTTRPTQGTPQGGVISPLLANIYLHWFEKAFHRPEGPGDVGQREDRPLRGRLRGPGPRRGSPADRVDRIATRRPLPADDQPEEDARGEAAANRGRAWTSWASRSATNATCMVESATLSERVPVAEGRTPGCGSKLREMTGPQWGWMPLPALIGEAQSLSARAGGQYFRHGYPGPGVFMRSTVSLRNAWCATCSVVVNAVFVCQRTARGTPICRASVCNCCRRKR